MINILGYRLNVNKPKNTPKTREGKIFTKLVQTAVQRTRTDIGNWRAAIKQAESVDSPSRVRLYNIYNDVLIDALLTSQIQNRKLKTTGADIELLDENGKVNDGATSKLNNSRWFNDWISDFLDTDLYGFSVFEFETTLNGGLNYALMPRKHVKPLTGEILIRENDTTGVKYRETPEFGTWLIEAGAPDELGLLNKAVPHVLMKRFAQSCWSEYCEIFGMPTRVLKTNTQDLDMLAQAENMMNRMGAAGWAIIDDSENLEFAQGTNTNGEVYNSLIRLCNNELSLLNSGAIIGQDTQFGSRGKEQSSQLVLDDLVNADMRKVETYANTTLLPALYKIGYLPHSLTLQFVNNKDLTSLWKMVHEALPYFDVPANFIENTFGIPVEPKKITGLNFSTKGNKGAFH